MPEGPKKQIATKRFFMRLAALYATPDGYIIRLAHLLEIHPKTLISQLSSETPISNDTIKGIARILSPIELPELREIHEGQ